MPGSDVIAATSETLLTVLADVLSTLTPPPVTELHDLQGTVKKTLRPDSVSVRCERRSQCPQSAPTARVASPKSPCRSRRCAGGALFIDAVGRDLQQNK